MTDTDRNRILQRLDKELDEMRIDIAAMVMVCKSLERFQDQNNKTMARLEKFLDREEAKITAADREMERNREYALKLIACGMIKKRKEKNCGACETSH